MTARRNHRDLTELTSREREVLDLLGLELTNEQIAERLGISLDGAKYHVSQILSKLGVSRREEAVSATSQKSRWARLRVPLGARIIGGALLVLALGGAGVLAARVALDGDPGPVIGDHWHAPYAIYVGDDRQEVFASLDSGMTTPGDGIIHIEPRTAEEERENASLARFFEDAGGELTDTSLRLPGSDTTYRNGDNVPGIGATGSVFIVSNTVVVPASYVPQDGDRIRILFTTDEAVASYIDDSDTGPVIGDHWHAPYKVYIGDEQQEVFSSLDSSMTTLGDGIIHIEPRTATEERENASLARFFEDAGGELTDTSLRLPDSSTTYRNGDNVPGTGEPIRVIILSNARRAPADYVPQDGDLIHVIFGTDESVENATRPKNQSP